MKRLFSFIAVLLTLLFWSSCENLVEDESPVLYSKPSSVEVSASNSRESLDVTLAAKPVGRNIQSVTSVSFVYSLSEDLANPTTVIATADGYAFTTTFRTQDYGNRLYYQATIVSALGSQMTSSVRNILVPSFGEFVKVSAPELVEFTSSCITLKADYKSPAGIAIAERGFCWSSELAVPNIENNRVIAESGFQAAIEGLEQMQTMNARAYVKDASGNISYSEVAVIEVYVDLGLSVKWATCNLGATKPEEYGLYYQWGDTQGYGSMTSDGKYFGWSNNGKVTYKWCNGSYDTLSKYNTSTSFGLVDNKTVLDPEDDAAHVALGGKWRMPTEEEWTELWNNCTWKWATVNGIQGYRGTSNKSGYTDKSIFLPAAGYRDGGSLDDVGSRGIYWSSSLYTNNPSRAYEKTFWSDFVYKIHSRYHGQSIRPVSE